MRYAAAIALLIGFLAAYAAGDSLSVISDVEPTAQATTIPAPESAEARDQRQAIANMRRRVADLEEENARLRKELGIYQTREADRIIQTHATPTPKAADTGPAGEKTVHVRAYTRSDGTQVREHWRREPKK